MRPRGMESWYAIGMRICVIGSGYVGLVAGAGFADMGNDVICCDVDAQKIDGLQRGVMPIYEPGLDKLVMHNAAEGRLTFTTNVASGVAGAEVVLLAVGTPPGPDGSADLSYIMKAAEDVAGALTGWAVIVTKSTVPVGTGDKIEAIVAKRTKHEFAVASNPEFLKEGDALADFMKPDRVVIGTSDKRAVETLKALYAPFTRTNDRMLLMDRRSAELTKYAANSMLATRISFMNDLANLCEILGADIELVRRGMGSDVRIGPKFLFAGPGFGGSCFPKDLRAAISTGREVGYKLEVLDAVVEVNERQKRRLGEKVTKHFGGNLKGKKIAVWGLAFKPGTDDIREAPALVLIEQLLSADATVSASDPVAIGAVRKQLGDRIVYEEAHYDCARGADALVLVTEWHEFRRPSFERLKSLLSQPVVFDGRNVWDPAELRAAGFKYYGIGRGKDA
jgi:UDPglucose 6-dehydrogenase